MAKKKEKKKKSHSPALSHFFVIIGAPIHCIQLFKRDVSIISQRNVPGIHPFSCPVFCLCQPQGLGCTSHLLHVSRVCIEIASMGKLFPYMHRNAGCTSHLLHVSRVCISMGKLFSYMHRNASIPIPYSLYKYNS